MKRPPQWRDGLTPENLKEIESWRAADEHPDRILNASKITMTQFIALVDAMQVFVNALADAIEQEGKE